MKALKILGIVAVVILPLTILAAVVVVPDESAETRTTTETTTTTEAAAPSDDPVEVVEEEPAIDPEPDGDYKIATCDLGDIGIHGGALIGSVRVKNTGDVELTARVPFKWQLGNGEMIEAPAKVVTLPEGRGKLLFFEVEVSQEVQSSFQDHPGYFNSKNCRSPVEMIG